MGLFDKFKKSEPVGRQATSAKILKVSDFLSEKTIAFYPAGPSKRQLFGNLLGLLDLPNPGEAVKSILAREESGSTVIAPGIALPHARISGITTIKAALGLCPSGVQYSHAEPTPVKLILLFLGPADNMREHLAFLASVSALFQREGLPESLVQLTTPKAIIQKIKDAEKAF